MDRVTVYDLTELMRQASGDTTIELGEGWLDRSFADLGCDSLAVLDIAGRIQRDYKIAVPDDGIEPSMTPRDALDTVNRLAGPA